MPWIRDTCKGPPSLLPFSVPSPKSEIPFFNPSSSSSSSILSLMEAASSPSTGDEPCNTSPHSPELRESESLSSEWTDEKHSQYLKSMEASFVNQLYDSMEVLGWRTDKEKSADAQSRQHHNKCIYSPSGQFKVLRDGCWKKINFERPCPVSNTCAKSHVILKSPWIQHFRSASRPQVSASSDIGKVASLTDHCVNAKGKAMNSFRDAKSQQRHVCPTYLIDLTVVGDKAEVSDQNFVDDDAEATDQNSSCGEKRSKTLGTNSPTYDQVVPFSGAPSSRTNTGKKEHCSSS
ncbi:hypothetical protein MLD38_000934 [Melastoma candidum]|uniref:Uncharacterized protein n=1 Tax=Melastoma candidum TaxID=119954 RepID=A0ACB9SCY9_9MYRT|nr:hypothetical protein MLD38_000934 [Melastoma candidum]